MLTDRTQAIKSSLFAHARQISLERARLYTESYTETEGDPPILRRAKALRHVLENHELVVDEHDLLVGNRSETPRAGVLSPEMSPYWILDELDEFSVRPQDPFEIAEEDKAYYRDVLYPFWAGKSLNDWYRAHVSDAVLEAQRTRIFAVAQTDKGQGHIICDFPHVLQSGFGALAAEAHLKMERDPTNEFYKAAALCLDAVVAYVHRYEQYVCQLARTAAPKRAQELTRMAEVLAHIATEPPRDLYEALQLVWLVELVLQHESNASSCSFSLGRADQYLYPFWRASKEAGTTDEDLRELLQCFYLKTNTIVAVRSKESASFFAGFPIGFNLVVGGVDASGNDCSNELSELLLDIQNDTRLPQPNLSLRVHKETPDSLLHKACEIIRLGDGVPQCFNDEINIPAFLRRGIREADARDYAVVGCVELSIPGRMYGLHDISMFNMMRCFEITLAEHPEGFATYDALVAALEKTIDTYIAYMVEGCNACDEAHRQTSPTPFLSTLVKDCMDSGRDVTFGGARYNPSGVQGVGTANLADSLMVIKRAVFEKKDLTYTELLAALARNWKGPGDEVLRQRCIHKYPKYGNDVEEVDEIGRHFLAYFGHSVAPYSNVRDGHFQPGSYTVSAHVPLGAVVGATPDGRYAGEQLADGGLSPMVGRDTQGPTALLKSVAHLDNILDSNGSLLNVKFCPATLAGESGLSKLSAYLRAFSRLNLQHVQFNVVDRATLIDAQNHPERYSSLVVRVAGYSALFVELSRAIQNDIIARTEHML